MTMEEVIEAEFKYCDMRPNGKKLLGINIAQALRDAGYIHRDELLTTLRAINHDLTGYNLQTALNTARAAIKAATPEDG